MRPLRHKAAAGSCLLLTFEHCAYNLSRGSGDVRSLPSDGVSMLSDTNLLPFQRYIANAITAFLHGIMQFSKGTRLVFEAGSRMPSVRRSLKRVIQCG